MTSKEIMDLIKTKKASAEADYSNQKDPHERLYILGELDAYQDLLINIEQAEIKEAKDNKELEALEILKQNLKLSPYLEQNGIIAVMKIEGIITNDNQQKLIREVFSSE